MQMLALRMEQPGEIRIIQAEIPCPKPGEALLRVCYNGICGADTASYTGNQPFTSYPRIPGHEFSAEIAEIGPNEKGLSPGDLVTANPYFNCGVCYACRRGLVNACMDNQTMGVQRDGSFAQYITMPVARLFPGSGLSAQTLALIEPFSISRHALSRAKVRPGDRLLIVGAGPIGLFALLAANALGARVMVTDLHESRLALAARFNAERIHRAGGESLTSAAQEFTQGDGFDVCVEACGLPETFLHCITQAAHGANVILIGNGRKETCFNHSVLLKKELNVFGSRNAFDRDFTTLIRQIADASAGISEADLSALVSRIYPLRETQQALQALTSADNTLVKVLISMREEDAAPC